MKSARSKLAETGSSSSGGGEHSIDFPIVGIGASAGGLETFEQFFQNVPANVGMAFVVVQHLTPTHSSILSRLLERSTDMPVSEVEDDMPVRPDHVYVIPPGRRMTLRDGALRLAKSETAEGSRTAIDTFFRSLAEAQGESAICVILSGTGADGTAGLRAVKDAGGLVIAQDPRTAKYTGMPQSAIDTNLVDYIMTPGEMPDQIVAYTRNAFLPDRAEIERRLSESNEHVADMLAEVLRHTGHDFSFYKPSTINRRIEHRMALNQIEDAGAYLARLRSDPAEVEALFYGLLIGVTGFFRDPEAWARLEEIAIPALLDARSSGESIRVWVPGASTGEEAYSIAILLAEAMEARNEFFEVEIFAADIDERGLEKARAGVYSAEDISHLSSDRLARFFHRHGEAYAVKDSLRKMVYCIHQNVLKDPPFSRLDLISCRNFLIYLGIELQSELIALFHYVLNPGGFLFLGASESLGEQGALFRPVHREARIFRRADVEPRIDLALDFIVPVPSASLDLATLALAAADDALEEEDDTFGLSADATPEERVAALQQGLDITRERLQATIEELRITNEELQSTNKELLTHEAELEAQNEELRDMQEELELSRDAFSDLYDYAPVGYMTLNGEGVVEQANLTLGAMLGVSRHNLIGQRLADYVASGGEEAFNRFFEDLRATGGRQSYVVRMTYMDDGEFYGQLESIAAHDAAADKTHYRVAVINVTARVEAEQALREAHDELEARVKARTAELVEVNESLQGEIAERREVEVRLEQTLARTRDLYRTSRHISSLDTPMGVLETLLSNRNLADASRASLIIFDDPHGAGPPTYTEPIAVWQRDLSSKQHHSFDKNELLKLCQRDGPLVIEDSQDDPRIDSRSRKSFESISTRSLVIYPLVASGLWYGVIAFHWTEPHRIADDEARHILGLVDQAAAAIYTFQLLVAEAQARQAAERANEVKIKFLAMISHELRTPLTSIQGYADTLLAEDVDWDADTQRMFIQIINDESDNLRELIEQLLDLSRLEAGMLTIHREPHPMGAILADARPHLNLRATEHNLVYDVPDDLPFVDVDPQRIQQVIQNLVHNSAKYAPAGTTIRVAARVYDGFVRVDVDDEGPGIPREERDVVFEAFQQAAGEVDAAQGGAGLGLAICRGIVSAHGGDIWISDEVEKGLRVSFTLPIAVPEEDA